MSGTINDHGLFFSYFLLHTSATYYLLPTSDFLLANFYLLLATHFLPLTTYFMRPLSICQVLLL